MTDAAIQTAIDKAVTFVTPESRSFTRARPYMEVDDSTLDSFADVIVQQGSMTNAYTQAMEVFRLVAKRTYEIHTVDSVMVLDKTVPILRVRMRSDNPVRSIVIDTHDFLRFLNIENDHHRRGSFLFTVNVLVLCLLAAIVTAVPLWTHTVPNAPPIPNLSMPRPNIDVVGWFLRSTTARNLLRSFI